MLSVWNNNSLWELCAAAWEQTLSRTNKRTNSLSYPEIVDIVLILVDSKCNFVTCEFVTISTSNNWSRIVILIYNIIYLYKLLLLIIYNLILLSHLPSSISNLLNVTKSKVTKYNLCNLSLIRLIVFVLFELFVRLFVRSNEPHALYFQRPECSLSFLSRLPTP